MCKLLCEYIARVSDRSVSADIYHYATNRQVAGSIPDGVIGILQCAITCGLQYG